MSAAPQQLPTVDGLPSALTELRAWLTWKYVQKAGEPKPRKIPFYANGQTRHGTQGSSEDRAALVTFEAACAAAKKHGRTGVGLAMLPEHDVVALDFDNCVANGIVEPRVAALVTGTYTEISPSGRGVRAFLRGQLKDRKTAADDKWPFGFETFHSKGFVTVTGHSFGVEPLLGPYVAKMSDAVREHYAARFPVSQAAPQPAAEGVAPNATIKQLREALKDHDANALEPFWWECISIIHHETGGSAEGRALAHEWSFASEKYDAADLDARWRSMDGRTVENPKTIASLRIDKPAAAEDFEVVTPEEAAATDMRPLVRLRPGKLDEYAEKCQDILCPELYVQSNALVRTGGATGADTKTARAIRRDHNQLVILPATVEYIRGRLTKLARIEQYYRREKKWERIDCPRGLAEHIAYQKDWPAFPRLEAIARAPFVRDDGSICEVPGYDAQSRIIYSPNAEFPAIPANPSRDDALCALASLLEPFDEFPFSTDAARSTFVACILTEAARAAMETSPAFFFTAPAAGTGKTLLASIPALLVHGHVPPFRPWAERDDELRKGLFASLLAGDRTIAFDNLQNGAKIRSAILCNFLTALIYTDRKLGVSETPSVVNRSVVVATGNNITPTSDLARRSVVVRIDANTAHLKERTFKLTDLRGFIAEHRPRLLVAALTIVRAHILADVPGSTPLPTFERWSRFVRDALLWLGMADPVETQADETDDETSPLADAFHLIGEWANRRGKEEFFASDLAEAEEFNSEDDPLAKAIEAAGCSDARDKQKVGFWLRDRRDRVAGDFKLLRLPMSRGTTRWCLRRLDAPQPIVNNKDDSPTPTVDPLLL